MPKVKLIATRDMMYNTRRLKAGDRFEARAMDAVVLTDIRKSARPDYSAAVTSAPLEAIYQGAGADPAAQPSEQVAAALALGQLREEAESLGIRIDRRWAEGRLRDEIEKAKARAEIDRVQAEQAAADAAAQAAAEKQEPAPAEGGEQAAVETTASSGLFSS